MSQVNIVQVFVLLLAFALTGACGAHFYKQLGFWGMLPTICLGLVLAIIVGGGIVSTIRESAHASRQKNGPTSSP
jgi:hypothetical protein